MEWSSINLGLNEGKALEAMIHLREATVNDIAKISKIPQNKTYAILDSLEKKGFIGKIMTSPATYSSINALRRIKEIIENNEKSAKKLLSDANKIIPKKKETSSVKIFKGKNNWYNALNIIASESRKNTKMPFSYSIKSIFEYHPQYLHPIHQDKKDKIETDRRNIGPITENTLKNVEKFKKEGVKIKNFENSGIAVSLTNNSAIIGLINENTTITITNPDFIKMMKNLFEAAWKSLK